MILERTMLVAAVTVAVIGCSDPSSRWEVGGVYSISDGGQFRVAKVLAIDPEAVSIRIYRESFPTRPAVAERGDLSLGKVDDPEGFGIGHIPLSPKDFALTFPVKLRAEPVGDDELDGYRIWKESGGVAFSFEEAAEEPAPQEVGEQ